jgi:hypothetical protein
VAFDGPENPQNNKAFYHKFWHAAGAKKYLFEHQFVGAKNDRPISDQKEGGS